MSHRKIIQAILSKNTELTEAQVLTELDAERNKTAGLIADATLLRLIAARRGVETPHEAVSQPKLRLSHLVPNLNRITVSGRVIATFPVKTFEGEKPGKYASLLIADKNGTLRVILWNDKAELVESGAFKVGQVARILRCYTREDRNGNTELHVSEKSEVEVDPADLQQEDYPWIERFLTAIKDISLSIQSVHVAGSVKAVFPSSTFTRQDNSVGRVLRFIISDGTGEVTVVAWNEKAEKLESSLLGEPKVTLVNARVKAASGGAVEVHVDETTYVEVSAACGRQ
jgi:ssDNA-binding replication factor A large subunit